MKSLEVRLFYLITSPNIFLALAFLTKKGYVHRDISPGNIIIYKGHAKLNDLEFAKEYGTRTSNNIRTVSHVPPNI